jgi:hypothetical protein
METTPAGGRGSSSVEHLPELLFQVGNESEEYGLFVFFKFLY